MTIVTSSILVNEFSNALVCKSRYPGLVHPPFRCPRLDSTNSFLLDRLHGTFLRDEHRNRRGLLRPSPWGIMDRRFFYALFFLRVALRSHGHILVSSESGHSDLTFSNLAEASHQCAKKISLVIVFATGLL
jgi:hypothetical protein